MFRIGEFSRLAQLSVRVLRHYDEIGLLRPAHTDPVNGYRYYTAEQLTDVNRIVALKELGLSLAQVHRLTRERVSTDELVGMLRMEPHGPRMPVPPPNGACAASSTASRRSPTPMPCPASTSSRSPSLPCHS